MTIPSDAVVFITGASSGIGAALAAGLAVPGRTVHLQGRDAARLASTADLVAKAGATPVSHLLDLADHAAVDAFAAEHAGEVARLDALVHSAGTVVLGAVATSDIADLDHQYAVNLRAPFVLTNAFLPALEAASGQVLFVNSGAGLRAGPHWSQYAATKFGLKALADSLRAETDGTGVRVTTVFPGRTATPMQQEVHRMEGREYDESAFMGPEHVAESILHALEIARNANVVDLSIR